MHSRSAATAAAATSADAAASVAPVSPRAVGLVNRVLVGCCVIHTVAAALLPSCFNFSSNDDVTWSGVQLCAGLMAGTLMFLPFITLSQLYNVPLQAQGPALKLKTALYLLCIGGGAFLMTGIAAARQARARLPLPLPVSSTADARITASLVLPIASFLSFSNTVSAFLPCLYGETYLDSSGMPALLPTVSHRSGVVMSRVRMVPIVDGMAASFLSSVSAASTINVWMVTYADASSATAFGSDLAAFLNVLPLQGPPTVFQVVAASDHPLSVYKAVARRASQACSIPYTNTTAPVFLWPQDQRTSIWSFRNTYAGVVLTSLGGLGLCIVIFVTLHWPSTWSSARPPATMFTASLSSVPTHAPSGAPKLVLMSPRASVVLAPVVVPTGLPKSAPAHQKPTAASLQPFREALLLADAIIYSASNPGTVAGAGAVPTPSTVTVPVKTLSAASGSMCSPITVSVKPLSAASSSASALPVSVSNVHSQPKQSVTSMSEIQPGSAPRNLPSKSPQHAKPSASSSTGHTSKPQTALAPPGQKPIRADLQPFYKALRDAEISMANAAAIQAGATAAVARAAHSPVAPVDVVDVRVQMRAPDSECMEPGAVAAERDPGT